MAKKRNGRATPPKGPAATPPNDNDPAALRAEVTRLDAELGRLRVENEQLRPLEKRIRATEANLARREHQAKTSEQQVRDKEQALTDKEKLLAARESELESAAGRDKRVQAALNKAEIEAAKLRKTALADARATTAASEKEKARVLDEAHKEARTLVDDAAKESSTARDAAREAVSKVLDEAQRTANATTSAASTLTAEAEQARRQAEEAQSEAAARLTVAEAKEASLKAAGRAKALKDEGRREVEAEAAAHRAELLAATEAEVQRRLDAAKADAKRLAEEAERMLSEARVTSQAEVAAAHTDATDIQERAQADATEAAQELARNRERDAAARKELGEQLESAIASRATETEKRLLAQDEELQTRSADLDAQQQDLVAREHHVARQRADLEARESEVVEDRQQVEASRASLQDQERRTGVARVADLEAHLDEESARSASLLARLQAVTVERDGARELAEAAQPGSLRLQEQLEDLEREVIRVKAINAESARPEELDRLRDAAADADELRAENARLRQNARDLKVTQRGFDEERARHTAVLDQQQLAGVRAEQQFAADRGALEERLAEVKGKNDELLRLRDEWEDAARERTRLTERLDHLQTENTLLQKELTDIHKKSDERTEGTFGRLAQIEDGTAGTREPATADTLLEQVQTRLQARGFQFERRDVAVFLAGLATTRLQILQGVSGTGKTSLVREMAHALGAEFVSVPVQAGWRERADLFGSWNAFARQFECSPFTEALYRARTAALKGVPVFILLDEVNLSRVEYYLADLLSVLEQPDEDHVIELFGAPLPAGLEAPPLLETNRRSLRIAPNIWLFGTANEDESTMEITDKVYDRSVVLQLDQRAPRGDLKLKKVAPLRVEAASLRGLGKTSAKALRALDTQADAFFAAIAPGLRDSLDAGIGNRLSEQLRQFLPAIEALGLTKGEALDHVVATRLLRRVARVRDPYMSKSLSTLAKTIENAWPSSKDWGQPKRSVALLEARAKRLAQR